MLSGILNTLGFGNDEDPTKGMDELQKEMYQDEQLRNAPAVTTDVTTPTTDVAAPSLVAEDSGPGLMDRLSTSRIQTWNPQTMKIEEQEVPTWWRAGKGLAAGLSAYGRNLLISGGDEGKAWAGGIDAAFGSLDSEVAAQKKSQDHQARVAELIKDGKYTPASISVYARSGDPSYLVPEKMVMSQKEQFDANAKLTDQQIKKDELNESIRSAKVNESISQMNANTALYNAETGRYNAEVSLVTVDGADVGQTPGTKYVVAYNSRTGERGVPMLADSKEAKELLEKSNATQANINAANDSLKLVDEMLKDDVGRKAAVGALDARVVTAGEKASNFEANHNTLTSKMFLDNIKNMKGMGALSDAEGKKLESAIAGLDLKMNQDAYKKQLEKVKEHYIRLVEVSERERQTGKTPSTATTPSTTTQSTNTDYSKYYK